MTVFFSKKCELAIQAVLFLSVQPEGVYYSAGDISIELKVSREFVSKVLQTLTFSGLVGSKKGKSGGFYLAMDPAEIRLIKIVEIIDGFEVFEKCILGFPGCSPENPCPMHHRWGALRDNAFSMLTHETLADLRDQTIRKIRSLKN